MATKEPPDPPADRPFADKVTKDSITVVWPGTTYDGGSIVTGYVVEMQKKGETKWKVLTEDVFSTSYQVNGLKESEIYLFRVCCVNAVGKSKPSLVSEEITPSDSPQEEMDEEDEPDEQAFEPRDVKVKDTNVRDFYQIKEELGRGKFGTVNKCVEKKTKRILAAKFIKVTSQTDREEVDNEVSIMQILQHPKLLQLYDAFASGDNYVLILEFVSGGELFERVVAEDFQLTEKEVVFFMRQICEGVVFMHLKNILHLDMKPENILCVRPKSNKIKIIDFGLARKYNPKETLKVMFGTPEFTAPEVINYDKITKATDMWSVGVICYVLLSGLSPFMGDNDGETMSNVTSAEWDFEDESFDEISDASKEFIENLLVLDPTERLSAAECLEHDWIKKDVASSHKISKARIRRFLARRKWQKAIRRTRQFLRKGKIPPVPYPSILPSFPPALVTDTDTDNGEILGRRRESESELSSSYLPHRRFSEPTGSDSDSYFTAPETEDAPKFLKRIEKQDAVEGQPVKFECVVSGNPKPTVIWLRNNFPIREGDDFKFLQEGERFILHMSAVYPEDAGLYTAKAINAAGYLNCSAELHVEEAMTDEEYRTPVELLTTGESTESETETLRVQIEQDSDATDTEDTAPEFTKKMKSAEVVEGDLVRFDCKVTGTPMPDITWCKDGHVLSIYGGHHRFFTDDNGVCAMVIPQTTLHDNGEYSCSAANFVGKVSCSASLLVKEKVELPPEPSPPDFTSTFKDLTIVEGSTISLQCTVSGYPEPDVMWILNGRVIQPATDIRMMFDGETASFTRVKALPEDSGVYTCRLTNMHGETHSCNARVTVVEESRPPTYKPSPPKFLQSFTDVVVVEGNEVKFECTIVGTPTPEVMWYYQRKPIKETSDFKFIQDGLKYTLHIVEAFPEDEGEYTCKACNSAGETSWSAELFVDEQSSKSTSSRKVRSKGFPPSFIHELQDVTVFEGSAVTLECKVTGLPEPSLSWNCNGQEVESDDNRKLQFLPDGTTSVVFSSATKSDEGEYTCIAESSTGKSTSTALLTVLPAEAKEKSDQLENSSEIGQEKSTTGIPLPPERPPEITDVTATNLAASWPACLQDAAASPVTYIVELRELPADEWFCVGVGIPDTELLVENLLPSTEYEFQVRAENVFGVSEPSQVSQVIVTLPIDDASKRDLYKQRRASSAEGLPYFIGTPEEVYVQPNQTARLQCSVRADPVLEVCWIHDGQIIPNDGRYQHSVSSTGVCSLKIEEVKTEDVGEYECVATNDIGTSRIALFLDLAEPPKFLTELEDQTVKAGQPLRLECRIGGIPEPDIFWYKDDMFVEETSNIQVIFEGEDICGLAFAQITMDDTGEYMIKAKNIAGECSNSCIIMVEDPSSEDDTKTRKIRFKRKEKVENYYEVREELGRGAFGVVKRVITKKNGEDAAAKFIHAKPQMRRELKQEMQIMAQLDHMRLIKLLDAFETKRELIMVMELVTGGELFDKIVTEDCLTESEAVYFLRQVLEGLQHMHERLIVHLDLKPENILLVKPNDDNIKLIDFGLARKLQPGKDVFVKFGTPEFVAPEVVEKHPISTASDLWSLGVIAYVMLSGISPFMGDDDKQTLVHVKNGQWNFNDVVFNTVTEEAKDFISKLLILNPNNRMTTQECLDHPWLELADNRGEGAKLSTEKLKSFNARRKWQKALTAVKSAMRIRRLSTISSDSLSDLGRVSPGSTSAASDTEKSRATKSESSEDIQAEEGEISIKIPQLPLSRKKSSEEEKTQKDIEEFAPVFRVLLKDTPMVEGQPVEMSCWVIGKPTPTISWFKDDHQLFHSEQVKMWTDEQGKSFLRIEKSDEDDVGVYRCMAANRLGNVHSTAKVAIADLPDKPSRPRVPLISATEAFVTWKAPHYVGNCPLKAYKLQYRKAGEKHWVLVSDEIQEACLHVKNLEPDTPYRFRIACRNKIGSSPYSRSSAQVKTMPAGSPQLQIERSDRLQVLRSVSFAGMKRQSSTERSFESVEADEEVVVTLKTSIPQKNYNFEDEIGRGRFAVIKKCVEHSTNIEYAAKMLRIKLDTESHVLKEFELLKDLRHPRISMLHDAFLTPRYLILIMERYYGGPVMRYLASKGSYSEDEVVEFMQQLLDAVDYVHSQNIVHLDIRPDNVLLESRRRNDVRLIDFGSARKLTDPNGIKLDVELMAEFMAPEAVEGQLVNCATDIWSIGILTFIMLSGISPFLCKDKSETMANILTSTGDLSKLYHQVSDQARDFLKQALQRHAKDRPTVLECLHHPWLSNMDDAKTRRQDIVLDSRRLRDYMDDYRHQCRLLATTETMTIRRYCLVQQSFSFTTDDDVSEKSEIKPEPIV
ncbi:obscurin-like isoform X2 [Ptychodera flava]|uniref:obscurin-like isoform X2 n=1 Tax=Ptychodera flava TaxID=63121 RepID=UPI00396A0BA4